MRPMDVLEKAVAGERLSEAEVMALFDLPLPELAAAAHEVRLQKTDPEVVTFLIDRNINYTNVCTVACAFCAFYRIRRQEDAYTLTYEAIARKVEELYQVGGRRILMQGGVNPDLPLEWYLDLLRYLKNRFPDLRIDAFSPEEILGLERLTGLKAGEILEKLMEAGLDGMPGAGAEILVDEVRHKAAPARIQTADWYRIVDAAQALGLYTLASMVIGFGEGPRERTLHLLGIRAQQDKALKQYRNGFAAFALWTLQVEHTRLKGKAPGATAHEYLKTLAIARLALDNFAHLQASWPTLGFKVAQAALYYGADDFGSTMLEENVVSAAGGHGRTHATVREIVRHIVDAGFKPAERDPLYRILRYPDPKAILGEEAELPLA
ncbi:dehypoxanthine futalosine cyclase [Thermus scotoductus]|uniref:Cyclic dehypoxanthine futalosine synthase n=2 Tax=Thermus scotoductus TaxID=37636 RepID=A0A430RQ08_THESC|nr:dehypoxanthine futalosine cyclase [Thermus scotoductus]